MVKILKLHDNYEEVRCPNCRHKWWQELFTKFTNPSPVHCPACKAPLKAPIDDLMKRLNPKSIE